MMIKGLNNGEAVKFNNGFLACASTPYGNRIEVDGVISDTRDAQFFTESLDNIYKVINHPARTVGRRNPETGEIVSIDDIYKERWEYTDYGETHYPDLDTHYRVESVIEEAEKWELVKEEATVTREKIEFRVVGTLEDTGSEFIDTSLALGQVSYRGNGMYSVRTGSIAKDEALKVREEFPDHNYEFPTHSNIKYVKIDGEFVFTKSQGDFYNDEKAVQICASLEDAKQIESSVREQVRQKMYVKLKSRMLNKIESKDVVDDLKTISCYVSALSPMQKSRSTKNQLVKKVNEIIARVESMHD